MALKKAKKTGKTEKTEETEEMQKMKMETVYKLTDENSLTRAGHTNQKQWGRNVTHTETGAKELCGPGLLHAYTNPLLAVLLNPSHASFDEATMLLWKCKARVSIRQADKVGCIRLTTIDRISLPVFTVTQRLAFAILVSMKACKDGLFQSWANDWLSGKDRMSAVSRTGYAAMYLMISSYQAYPTYLAATYSAAYESTVRRNLQFDSAAGRWEAQIDPNSLVYPDYAPAYAVAYAAAYAASTGGVTGNVTDKFFIKMAKQALKY